MQVLTTSEHVCGYSHVSARQYCRVPLVHQANHAQPLLIFRVIGVGASCRRRLLQPVNLLHGVAGCAEWQSRQGGKKGQDHTLHTTSSAACWGIGHSRFAFSLSMATVRQSASAVRQQAPRTGLCPTVAAMHSTQGEHGKRSHLQFVRHTLDPNLLLGRAYRKAAVVLSV